MLCNLRKKSWKAYIDKEFLFLWVGNDDDNDKEFFLWNGWPGTARQGIFLAETNPAQKMKFSIEDFFSKCDQIRRKLRISSHLLKTSLMDHLIFWAVYFFFFF